MSASSGPAPRILVLTENLMFGSRVVETLKPLGYAVASLGQAEDLTSALGGQQWDLLIVDLDAGGASPEETLSTVREAAPFLPVLGFGRHTEPKVLRAARRAGFTEVAVRSTFVQEMPQLVKRCLEKRQKPTPARP